MAPQTLGTTNTNTNTSTCIIIILLRLGSTGKPVRRNQKDALARIAIRKAERGMIAVEKASWTQHLGACSERKAQDQDCRKYRWKIEALDLAGW
ncbi:hypothetical protein PG994_001415 [Apiospora phragmitis]|uniref:Uncharacterized protein n=1 Tax=Apiospora phragmitis TaxID=2905665 RepID=A0ABR1WTG7_9PEZI